MNRFRQYFNELLVVMLGLVLLSITQGIVSYFFVQDLTATQLRARQMVLAQQLIPQLEPELSLGALGGHLGTRFRSIKDAVPGIEPYVIDNSGRVLFYIHEASLLKRDAISTKHLEQFQAFSAQKQLPTEPLLCDDPRQVRTTIACSIAQIKFGAKPAYLMVLLDRDWASRDVERHAVIRTITANFAVSVLVFSILGALIVWILEHRRRDVEASLAEISHDVRSPLACLIGYLEALEQRGDNMEQTEHKNYLNTSLRSARSIEGLNREVLELSSLSLGGTNASMEILSLDELALEVVERFRERAEKSKILIESQLPPETILVKGNPRLLERLLSNLLENAIRHSKSGTGVQIILESKRKKALIRVLNSVTESQFLPWWKSLFQIGLSAQQSSNGLRPSYGLAIVSKIVALHRGTFRLRNRKAISAVAAYVRLPLL